MSNFDHMISYLASKGVQLVVKTNYSGGVPCDRVLMTKLTISKPDQFYRVNGKIVSAGMAKELIRIGEITL